MPSWPVTLPAAPLMDRFQETPPDTLVRTRMDQGPDKLRRRTTAGAREMRVAYILDKAQVAALDAFYMTDTAGGAAAFSYAHPRTGAGVSCRFKMPPEYVCVNGDYFRATLSLEILP